MPWQHIKSYNISKITIIISVLFTAYMLFIYVTPKTSLNPNDENPVVNICEWYGVLPPTLLKEFEKETGIRVQHDVFDNNEVLEAKLLSKNSGYDVVFPTASPFVKRQIQVGIYQPLQIHLLPDLTEMNPQIVEHMKDIDPNMTYAIPFYWGTIGIMYDEDIIKKHLPHADLTSNSLIMKPENLQTLRKYGISFLEEAVDVMPLIQLYLKYNPKIDNYDILDKCQNHFKKLRPYIRRFSSTRFMNDMIVGEICIAQAWSGEAHLARDEVKNLNRKIVYMIPKEGTILWIDCIAIPSGAPHPKNAHRFINFLLRPHIAAQITNSSKMPTTITQSKKYVNKELTHDPTIFVPNSILKKCFMPNQDTSKESLTFDRVRTKKWTEIRLNR